MIRALIVALLVTLAFVAIHVATASYAMHPCWPPGYALRACANAPRVAPFSTGEVIATCALVAFLAWCAWYLPLTRWQYRTPYRVVERTINIYGHDFSRHDMTERDGYYFHAPQMKWPQRTPLFARRQWRNLDDLGYWTRPTSGVDNPPVWMTRARAELAIAFAQTITATPLVGREVKQAIPTETEQ